MKLSLITSLALAAAMSAPAFAASDASDTITINGSVADTCTLSIDGSAVSSSNATFAGSTIDITSLADATTAVMTPASMSLSFDGMCNYAHSIGLESANGGLDYTGSVSVVGGTFDDLVEYTVSASWDGGVSLESENTVANQSVAGAFREDDVTLAFIFDNDGGSDPLLSGAYTDSLTIQLGAAL